MRFEGNLHWNSIELILKPLEFQAFIFNYQM